MNQKYSYLHNFFNEIVWHLRLQQEYSFSMQIIFHFCAKTEISFWKKIILIFQKCDKPESCLHFSLFYKNSCVCLGLVFPLFASTTVDFQNDFQSFHFLKGNPFLGFNYNIQFLGPITTSVCRSSCYPGPFSFKIVIYFHFLKYQSPPKLCILIAF